MLMTVKNMLLKDLSVALSVSSVISERLPTSSVVEAITVFSGSMMINAHPTVSISANAT